MKVNLLVVDFKKEVEGVERIYKNLVLEVGDSRYPISVKRGRDDNYQVNQLLIQLCEIIGSAEGK